jgi:hypothetical protein
MTPTPAPHCSQKDLFGTAPPGAGPLVLTLKGIQAPRTLSQKKDKSTSQPILPNYHIPSFKNAKHWITKLPNGKPLKRPFLITSPEFQVWMGKAVQSLESQLLSLCQTGSDGTQLVRSRLFAMLSRLPADDSVNDLPEGSWKVKRVPPGEEGAIITIERL